jgi:hypothetical protein
MFAACREHRAAWDELYLEYREENGDLKCPQTIVLLPDGKESGRINTSHTPEPAEVVALVAAAVAAAGPGLSEDDLAFVQQNLEEGRRLAADSKWIGAWRAWSAVLTKPRVKPYAEEAEREGQKAETGMKGQVEAIAARLVPGTAAKAFEELSAFLTEAAGTPIEKDVAARLKKAESDKAIAGEIKAWRLSVEADGLLREATVLTDSGETKKAERVIKKLLGPKYAGTAAQETARKLWPDVAVGG